MEMKKRVLFICVHNSARSQMAEAWLNTICGEYFEAQSAGLEPGTLNPLAVQVMAEAGIDISKKKTQAVFDVFVSGQLFAYVITVCDEASAEKCPIFPGPATRMHWSFPDPSEVQGSETAKLEQVRLIRDEIRAKIEQWCDEASAEKCPIFPGSATRMHWSFPDPSEVQGSETAKLEQVRIIRDEIRAKIEQWCDEVCLQTAAT